MDRRSPTPRLCPSFTAPAPIPRSWLAGNARNALSEVLGAPAPMRLRSPPPRTHRAPRRHPPHPGLTLGCPQRYTSVRGIPRTLYDTLLPAGLRGRLLRNPPPHSIPGRRRPVDRRDIRGAVFLGRPPPQPPRVAPTPRCTRQIFTGLVFDEWVELLPGADHIRRVSDGEQPLTSPPESELTGVAFHYDRPDAKAPHAMLIAVPPDLDRGWTPDTWFRCSAKLSNSETAGSQPRDLPHARAT